MAADPTASQSDSVKAFVQTFYDWYVPLALKPQDGFSYEIVLKQKPDYFSPALRQALKEDLDASEKNPDYIVGLDFDPILASQDPCEHYITGTVRQTGKNYEIDVSCLDSNRDKPDLIAEVMQQASSWVFINFIYPADGSVHKSDLLALLKKLKEERNKYKK